MRHFLHSLIALGALGFASVGLSQDPPVNDPNRDITPTPTTPGDKMDRTTTPRATTPRTTSPRTTTSHDDLANGTADDGFNPGWLGLIGLIGLAGLIPRDRREHHVATTHTGTTGHTGTGTHRAT